MNTISKQLTTTAPSDVHPTDEELIFAALSGNDEAFSTLFERHSRRTYAAILRITRNVEDAKDAQQDAILSAYLHLKSFKGRSQFSSWLMRIGINSALCLLRRNRARPCLSLDDDRTLQGICDTRFRDESVDIESSYQENEQLCQLRRAMMRLRPKEREILELHNVLNCSIRVLAQHAGITESATKSRLVRARKSLISSCLVDPQRNAATPIRSEWHSHSQ